MTIKENKAKGFTLLELLIVIAILAILSVALVLMLNPAETLKKGRDSQRMSDLATMKTAIGLYLTTVTTPDLTNEATDNDRCVNGGTPSIFYSNDTVTATIAGFTAVSTAGTSVDGGATSWLPVDFTQISGGSPISNLPLDPVNTVALPAAPANTDLVYRYACDKDNLTFEINATLESDAFTSVDNKHVNDGGNNNNLFEVGSSLTILPGGDTF
ncbi:type II secretion system GspH family protein [Patescibacteria group bacterium]|nr:type II secretion system GspH family protein [Patescibacteria group bacterium]